MVKDYYMNTFVKTVKVLLIASAGTGFLGKAIYAGVSGLSFTSALLEGFAFSLMMPLAIGIFCSFIWAITALFMDKPKDSRLR
jgi:hypothetical protein